MALAAGVPTQAASPPCWGDLPDEREAEAGAGGRRSYAQKRREDASGRFRYPGPAIAHGNDFLCPARTDVDLDRRAPPVTARVFDEVRTSGAAARDRQQENGRAGNVHCSYAHLPSGERNQVDLLAGIERLDASRRWKAGSIDQGVEFAMSHSSSACALDRRCPSGTRRRGGCGRAGF